MASRAGFTRVQRWKHLNAVKLTVDYAQRPGAHPIQSQGQGDNLNDPFIKSSFSDYTEQSFAKFIDAIRKEDKAPTDERADVLVRHFNEVVGHPSGMDLIYYPEPGADTSSAGITRTVAT
ncbi:bacteriocin immunity protein [Pseudomonas fluorescens]|uniref:bacteriocin immunity protein n=1 Tax=Pseudomonas fluorescens TaxID=294 RepID=UPI00296672A3|nr:bacteriocin immunity protein [Pseudomonas fluorescens]